MHRVYNLTDKTPPWEKRRAPLKVRVFGKEIPIGGSIELDDSVRRKDVTGLVVDGFISFDELPLWYVAEGAPLPLPNPEKKKRREGLTAKMRREEEL